jgi:hypothetical protein
MALVDGGRFGGIGNPEIDSIFSGMTKGEIGDTLKSNPQLLEWVFGLAEQEIEMLRGGVSHDVLYKYKPLDGQGFTMNIIENGEIYLPSMFELNDPFEGPPPYVYEQADLTDENIYLKRYSLLKGEHPEWAETQIRQVIDNQPKDLLSNEEHLAQCHEEQRKRLSKVGIYSLSAKKDIPLMWAHYANSHTGVCIGFDTKVLSGCVAGLLLPVVYKEDTPKIKLFEKFYESVQRSCLTKSRDWEYEQEYRLVKTLGAKEKYFIPAEGIVEIVFGCKMTQKHKDVLIHLISEKIPSCELYQAVQSKTGFELHVLPMK